jgi:uncharacterized membrane protein SpoIIM required for sporulation
MAATDNPLTEPTSNLMRTSFGEHTFRETIRNAGIVTRREVRDSFRDWRIMVPIFVLTLVFPMLANGMTKVFTDFFESNGATPMVDVFLPLLPMIVGFFPVSISLVIALETFVGEKERKSLEPLLSTPLTNTELYIGKTFAAMIPPLMASYVGIGLYLAGLVFGQQQWRPQPELVVLILLLTTAQALIMVTGAVVVSSQTTSTRASNLLASFIIIPVSLLVMFESYMLVSQRRVVLWWIVAGLIVADIILFGMGARLFNREELLGRTVDEINLKWVWQIFWTQFRGGADVKTLGDWYRKSVLPVLPKLRNAMIFVVVSIACIFAAGFLLAQLRPDLGLPFDVSKQPTKFAAIHELFNTVRTPSLRAVAGVLSQNMRVLFLATFLGIFTFGVMGVITAIVPFGALGYLLGNQSVLSLGVGALAAALVPHSLIAFPIMLISVAAGVRLGMIVTRPPEGEGVWDAWLRALADVFKVNIALVLPLLIVAAFVEVYITPVIVKAVLGV